jgi:hypothetical protein
MRKRVQREAKKQKKNIIFVSEKKKNLMTDEADV